MTDPATPVGIYPSIPGMDFDDTGDLWLVTNVLGSPSDTGNPLWQLRHYELQVLSPYYVENFTDRMDISEDLVNPAAGSSWAHCYYVADVAISYSENLLFVWAATIQGISRSIFVKYDISQSPPVKLGEADLLPFAIADNSTPFSGISRCDLEIDHSDADYEKCRIMAMYQKWNGSSSDLWLIKFDSDFNVLADELIYNLSADPWSSPFAYTINTDAGNRNLITIDYNMSAPYNDFQYFEMPVTDW